MASKISSRDANSNAAGVRAYDGGVAGDVGAGGLLSLFGGVAGADGADGSEVFPLRSAYCTSGVEWTDRQSGLELAGGIFLCSVYAISHCNTMFLESSRTWAGARVRSVSAAASPAASRRNCRAAWRRVPTCPPARRARRPQPLRPAAWRRTGRTGRTGDVRSP